MTLLLLFNNGVFTPAPEPPPSDDLGAGSGKKRKGDEFNYDRPYLSEYAELLREAVQKKQPAKAEKLAETIVEVALEQPQPPPQLEALIEIADKLRHLEARQFKMNLALARTLVIRARAAERAMQDEEDEMMLLLS